MVVPITRQFQRYTTIVQTTFVMLVLLFIVAVIFLLIWLSVKLLGIVILLGGLWLLLYLPWQMDYQRASFMGAGRFIGIILMVIGLILLFYG